MDNLKRFNRDILVWVVLAMALVMSLVALWITVNGQRTVSTNLQNFQEVIADIEPINGKDVTLEQVAEAVVKYCEQRNHCAGLNGDDGQTIQGPVGPMGVMGLPGMSIVGPQGVQGFTGEQGERGEQGIQGDTGAQGEPGKTLEQRCVVVSQTKRRIEQKYTDAETWEVLYLLSPGQRCPEEEN